MYLFRSFSSHPIVRLPETYPVFDFSKEADIRSAETAPHGIGKYNEKREGMYKTPLFENSRNIHMGIDIFSPIGTEIYSFDEGKIFLFGFNDAPGDYGYTVIVEYWIGDRPIYALYGHLSKKSLEAKNPGQVVRRGEVLGWIGDRTENGDWTPHLHFQLCVEKPGKPDLPGVVSEKDREAALRLYPDPRIVLGPIYFF